MSALTVAELPTISGLLVSDYVVVSRDAVTLARKTVGELLAGLDTDSVTDSSGIAVDSPPTLTSALGVLAQRGSDDIGNDSTVAGTSVSDALEGLASNIAALGGSGATAATVTYTPETPSNWPASPTPATVADGLNDLASRVATLGSTSVANQSTVTGATVTDALQWLAMRADNAVVTESGTTHNVLAANVGGYHRFTNAAAKTCTFRPEATEALSANGAWHLRNIGAGSLTIVAGAGVTINLPNGGSLIVPQGGTVTMKRVASDEFDLLGLVNAA